ncbi:Oligo-1,6-glucosidase [Roseivivax jejudonensis]|uniref:Oligo-1,6-glucosidase n=1 Tax=Roseivivax jejudonensis TaxID=1529041 RepID=A0A1X6ZZD7_9RHOB|nr:alpha-amylase family glycosyl hydrolase [Roseivivax jejudonensis]SLN65762.1 Oligo-1,6-glucosidase [Roseivivax jejudonensis]
MTTHAAWWQGATIYQIYPRSFLDTTGNGVGDLPGITRKLDYIAALGVDAIWISPFVQSPMKDYGYDVSDYRAVDPLFGQQGDVQVLFDEAHRRGLRVLMDQVLSHTSDQHPWFRESRGSRDNPKADWYVWADAAPDGGPPNNWLSVFGGASWQWSPWRSQYYLHNFLREQPDLNFHNPEVQEAVLDVCRYWLDLGADGFRLDVCAFYFHDTELRDNPPEPETPRGAHFQFNPYSYQRHVHDIGQPENLGFLERLRALTDEYEDRVLLGEMHQENYAQLHREYTAPGRLHLAYGYDLLGAEQRDPAVIRRSAEKLGYSDTDGWPCWAMDNHDFTRTPTRCGWEDNPDASVMALVALTCLRGAACLYQGSELALPEATLDYEDLQDPYGREFWPAYAGRDGARTPMPWTADHPNGDFSHEAPWLPVPPAHLRLSVATQDAQPGSPLNRIRRFLAWRRDEPALRHGAMRMHDGPEGVLTFTRDDGANPVFCAINLSPGGACVTPGHAISGGALEGHGFGCHADETGIHLPAWGAWFGRPPNSVAGAVR